MCNNSEVVKITLAVILYIDHNHETSNQNSGGMETIRIILVSFLYETD